MHHMDCSGAGDHGDYYVITSSAVSQWHNDITNHGNVAHGDTPGQSHTNNAYQNIHNDIPHGDSPHQNVSHVDDHYNTHSDDPHQDVAHQDGLGAHLDTAHTDVIHQDQPIYIGPT